MSHEELKETLKKLAFRATSDEILKRRLLADAMQVVREQELDVPPDQRVMAVLNKDAVELLLLPAMVDAGELTIAELEQVAGGLDCFNIFALGNVGPWG